MPGEPPRVRNHSEPRVVAVIVAYNRCDLLRQALDALGAQTRAPDAVVVIDNASTDSTATVARTHAVVTESVTLPRNTGGAGGFAAGIARAVNHHAAEAVWIMDDDTVPEPRALAALLEARRSYPGVPAVLASRVEWIDGREHPMNTPRTRIGVRRSYHDHARAAGARQIRTASFVSILLDAGAVKEEGLPIADYFLWNDDFEYTARLLRHRVGLHVPASRVRHLTKTFGSSDVDPGPRFFNEVRNKVWVFTRSPAFRPCERVLFSAATAARWIRTFRSSRDRQALLGHLRDGLLAARTPPRSTREVLAGTAVEFDVAAVEGAHG